MKKHLKNSYLMVIDKVIRLTISLGVGIWLARYLGPEDFGYIALYTSLYAILKVFNSFGLEQILVREIVKSDIEDEALKFSYFSVKICTGLLINTLFIIWLSVSQDLHMVFFLPVVLTFLFQANDFYELTSQVNGNSVNVIKIGLFSVVLSSLIKVFLILAEAELKYFILALSVELIVTLGFYTFHVNWSRFWIVFLSKKNLDTSKKIVRESLPLMISAASVVLYMKVDVLMITNILGVNQAGIYFAAVKLSEILYFIPSILMSGLFPVLVNKFEKNYQEYVETASFLMFYLILVSCIFVVSIALFSQSIVHTVYGEAYSASAAVLLVHIFSTIPVFIGVLYRKMAIVENLQKITLYSTIFGMVLNIILNIILIPVLGILGAALATLVSRMLSSVLFYFIFSDTKHFIYTIVDVFRIRTAPRFFDFKAFVK